MDRVRLVQQRHPTVQRAPRWWRRRRRGRGGRGHRVRPDRGEPPQGSAGQQQAHALEKNPHMAPGSRAGSMALALQQGDDPSRAKTPIIRSNIKGQKHPRVAVARAQLCWQKTATNPRCACSLAPRPLDPPIPAHYRQQVQLSSLLRRTAALTIVDWLQRSRCRPARQHRPGCPKRARPSRSSWRWTRTGTESWTRRSCSAA